MIAPVLREVEKRLVEEAVVAKELVEVAFVEVELVEVSKFTVEDAETMSPRVVVGARYPLPCTERSLNWDA